MTTVLLHGFTGDASSWEGVPGQAIDLFGHRREDAAPLLASWKEAIDALARELAPYTPCALTGYSLGARLALGLIIEHPALFTRATLIGVSPGLASEEERAARREADLVWAKLLETQGVIAFADAWEAQPVLRVFGDVPAERLARARAVRRRHSMSGLAWCLRVLSLGAMPNYWPMLGSITIPVHLVAGEKDEKFRAIAERMLPSLRRGTLELVMGAGHNVPLEHPSSTHIP